MNAPFGPLDMIEAAGVATPVRRKLADCRVGDTVAVLGGLFYLGEFRRTCRPDAEGHKEPARYAALWPSRVAHEAREPWLILAASNAHYLIGEPA